MNEQPAAPATRRPMRIGAIAAVLVAVAAIPLVRTQLQPEPDPLPPPEPTEVAPDIGRVNDPIVYDVDFLDQRHGFALWGRCTDGRDYRCERKLLVTENGVVWSPRGFEPAELAAPQRLAGRIIVLGPDRLLLSDSNNRGAPSRYYSGDGGRTWLAVTAAPSRIVPEIPTDAILETQCVERLRAESGCRQRRVVVTLPDSGHRAWLANPPPLGDPAPEQRPMPDGSWWVSGKDPATGKAAVAVSRDAGRTWSVSVPPIPPETVVDRLSIVSSGQTAYVLAVGPLPDGLDPRSLVAIFQSLDGGVTWTQTWRQLGKPPRTLGGAILAPDGMLFVALDDVGPGYRSLDGGRTFAAAFDLPRMTSIRRTHSGYLATASATTEGQYLTSADGRNWTEVQFP